MPSVSLIPVGRDGESHRSIPFDCERFPPEAARPAGVSQQQVRPGLRGVQRQNLGPGVQSAGKIEPLHLVVAAPFVIVVVPAHFADNCTKSRKTVLR